MIAGHEQRRWWISGSLALALHLAIIALALHLPARQPVAPSTPMQAVMLQLAPVPTSAPQPPMAAAPGPQQRAQKQAVAQPKTRKTPRVPDVPPTRQADVLATDNVARPEPVGPEAATAQATAPPGSESALSDTAAAPANSEGQRHGVRLTWESVLLGHLARYRQYPSRAERLRQQGTAWVRFTVDHAGNVSGVHLERGTGHPVLDDETLATVQRANPVPPPPAALGAGPIDVVVPVAFSLHHGD